MQKHTQTHNKQNKIKYTTEYSKNGASNTKTKTKKQQLITKKSNRTVKRPQKTVANELIKTNGNRLKSKIIQRLNVARIRTRSLALDHNNSENFNFYVEKHTMPKVTTHLVTSGHTHIAHNQKISDI